LTEKFWELVEEYIQLGFDPLRWIPTCSNEIDSFILQSSLRKIKRSSIKIMPSWFDAFHYIDGKIPELTRRIYKFNDSIVEKEVEIKRALTMFRLQDNIGDDLLLLSEKLQGFLRNFHTKVTVKKITTALTTHQSSQFAIIDYIRLRRGDKVGFMPANNSAIQITDPTQRPESEIHSNIVFTTAMENLNLLGCTSGFKVYPIYDAPTEDMLDKIRKNLDAYTSRFNLSMEDYSSLKIGKLFFGATAIANTLKELPIRYDQVEEGMQIILTNKFGTMPSLSLYMLTEMNNNNIKKFEQNNISLDLLSSAKEEDIKNLSEPHFSLGKIISKYCPDYGTEFDKYSHIAAVHPVTTDGVFAIPKLAELTNFNIVINDLPLKYDEIAKFATREFLIENATASSNGCHMLVTTKELAEVVLDDLRKHHFEPTIIGFFAKKEKPSVKFGIDLTQYVASKSRLIRLQSMLETQ
jgi:selenophosphate synthase